MSDKEYTLQQAADFLGVSERTVRRRVKDGVIPTSTRKAKTSGSPQYIISHEDLITYKATLKPRPSYSDLQQEIKALRREFSRFVSRVEAGAVNDGDMTRARRALGDDSAR